MTLLHQLGDISGVNRLRTIREARGLTLEQVALAAGTSHQQVQRLETGERRLTHEWMQRLAPALGVKPPELIDEDEGGLVPVVGHVGTGETVHAFDDPGAVVDRVEAPRDGLDAHAVIVRGDSMWPRYEDGCLLFFRATDRVAPESLGRTCVIQVRNGATYVKRLMKGTEPGRYRLVSFKAPDIEDADVLWAAPVLWVKER